MSRFIYYYGECHFAERHYAECHYAECYYAECHYAKCYYAECHYAEPHYAERHVLFIIMPSVIMMCVFMVNVAAPSENPVVATGTKLFSSSELTLRHNKLERLSLLDPVQPANIRLKTPDCGKTF